MGTGARFFVMLSTTNPVSVNLAQVSSLEEKSEFVAMVNVQQMVRATCLEVMGAPPEQLAEYRREVLELQSLIRGFRQDVEELKRQGQHFPPGSPSGDSIGAGSMTSEETMIADNSGADLVLRPRFVEPPTRAWYEGRALPRFSVKVEVELGAGAAPDGLRLRASFLNGRGVCEEAKANGSGALVGGERYASVVAGHAVWEQLMVCEASSKHYGSFTIRVDAVSPPAGVRVLELRSEALTVQVGRMWSKRRKSDDEISPDDSINQIPGVRAAATPFLVPTYAVPQPPGPSPPRPPCSRARPRTPLPRLLPRVVRLQPTPLRAQVGARYVARLQMQGICSIGQFAAMAGTPEGRDTLCRLCKGAHRRAPHRTPLALALSRPRRLRCRPCR